MVEDPLVTAIELNHLVTPDVLKRAIRYRRARARQLLQEARSLRRVLRSFEGYLDIGEERDPPIEESERIGH